MQLHITSEKIFVLLGRTGRYFPIAVMSRSMPNAMRNILSLKSVAKIRFVKESYKPVDRGLFLMALG